MVGIIDIEYYLPEKVLTNDDLTKEYNSWSAAKVYKKVGIKERHVTMEDETALDLGEKAALKLFKKNPELKEKVNFIILCTQSPDYLLPTSACILQHRLGITTSCGALDYNLGCSGFVYGLAMAKGLIQAGIAKNILLITSDTYTKYIHPMDKSTRTIFGDGAAAIWIGDARSECQIGEFVLGTDGSGAENLIVPAGGMRIPRNDGTSEEYIDKNNNIRSRNNLYMNGAEIFNFTLNTVPKLVEDTLCMNRVILNEVDYFIFHQANKYMLAILRDKINIPIEKFYINMETTGNTVSATIPIALVDAENQGLINKGSRIMIAGFGVGYSWGACIIKW